MHDRRNLAVGRERDLALHRHPDVRMGDRRPRRREAERKPSRLRPPIARPITQRTDSPSAARPYPAPLEGKVRRLDGGASRLSPPLVQQFLKQSSQVAAMARRVRPFVLALVAALSLAGCGFFGRPERPVWRTQAENACFARKLVALSNYIVAAPEIDGPGICGMTRPLKVSALADGAVGVDKVLTIDCPMIPALEAWLKDIVQPDAEARFGQKVATLNVFGAYSCRSVDNIGRRAALRTRLRQRRRRRRIHAGGRAHDRIRARLEKAPARRRRRSCTRSTPEPASISPPCSDRARTSSTTIISISISPTTARPTPARAGSASRRPSRASCRRPPRLTACRPAPEIEEPLDVARLGGSHASRAVALAPMSLTGASEGPNGALPPPLADSDPAPPILPPGAGPSVDPQPTSSIGDHDD